MDKILPFLSFYLEVLIFPIGAFVLCGLIVALCEKLFTFLAGKAGRGLVLATSIIGTPVHESGHAIMCLLFGHKITDIALWQPKDPDGLLGYVEHTYNKRNPYALLGNLFIGLGPIFSGLCVIIAVMALCFPGTLRAYTDTAIIGAQGGEDLFGILRECVGLIPSMISEESIPVWGQLIGAVIITSVCLHINLSPLDIKGSLRSMPIYMVICLAFSLIIWLVGEDCVISVSLGLEVWAVMVTVLYMIVITFSLSLVALSFIFSLIRKILGK